MIGGKYFDVFILNASGCAQFDHFWKNILGNLTTQPAVVGSIEIKEQFVCMCGNKDMSRVDSPSPSTWDHSELCYDTYYNEMKREEMYQSPIGRLTVSSIQCLCASKSPYIGGLCMPVGKKEWEIRRDRNGVKHTGIRIKWDHISYDNRYEENENCGVDAIVLLEWRKMELVVFRGDTLSIRPNTFINRE